MQRSRDAKIRKGMGMKILAAFGLFAICATAAFAEDFPTVAGGKVSDAQFKEGKTVLFFWTTWCPYCRKQIDFLKEQVKQFEDRGVNFVYINVGEDEKKVTAFVTENGMPADKVVLNPDSSLAYTYNVQGFPTYVFMHKGEDLTQANFFTEASLQKSLKLFDAMDAYDKQEAAKAAAAAPGAAPVAQEKK
jgi:thiol-disulfide isomerase/thioredoxin